MAIVNNPNEAHSHPDDESDRFHRAPYHDNLSHHANTHSHATSHGHSNGHPLNGALASKPHAFSGSVLTPDHARHLTPALALSLASALAVQAANAAMIKNVLPPSASPAGGGGVDAHTNLFYGSGVDLLSGGMLTGTVGGGSLGGTVGGGTPAVAATVGTAAPFPGNIAANPQTRRVLRLLQSVASPGTVSPVATSAHGHAHTHAHAPSALPHGTLLSLSESLEQLGHWRIQYTVWITEAWNVLKWSEPSAALFWEMATMYHTLYVASLSASGGGSASEARFRVLTLALGGHVGGAGLGPGAGAGGAGNVPPGSALVSLSGGGGVGGGTSAGGKGKQDILARNPHNQSHIPPILSCGSQSSMGSVRSAEKGDGAEQGANAGGIPSSVEGGNNYNNKQSLQHQLSQRAVKPARHSAKELPVWLISMFLLVHCEDQAFLRCTSGEDERRFSNHHPHPHDPSLLGNPSNHDAHAGDSLDFQTMLLHRSLSPRTRLHAGTHQNNAHCAVFLMRHLRKFLLLCAVPRNPDACRAVAALAAQGSRDAEGGTSNRRSSSSASASASSFLSLGGKSGSGIEMDGRQVGRQHEEEHRNIGLNVQLTLEELDRLSLVMQAPSGGPVEEPPIAIGEHILRCLVAEEMEAREAGRRVGGAAGRNAAAAMHRWNLLQNGLITVADAERILRQYLEAELTAALQELEGDENDSTEEVASKLTKLSLAGSSPETRLQPLTPPRSRGVSLAESTDADTAKESGSYFKELSYHKLRSTTVLLEPGKDAYGSPNCNNNADTYSVHSHNSHASSSGPQTSSHHTQSNPDPSNECGRLHDLHVADCSDTHFYLLQPFEHATVAACTDCTIVIGAVAGLLHVVDCERTTITSAARRVVVSNSFDVVHYIFTPSPPLLVGDNRGCQFAPYNTYYEGLRDDLLATGLAATLRSTNSSGPGSDILTSPARGSADSGGRNSPTMLPALQCASNKWKVPVEISKLEVPQLPNIPPPGSPTTDGSPTSPAADDLALKSSVDLAMKTPVLLPASEFEILLVPVESEEARLRRQLMVQSYDENNNDEDNPMRTSPASDMVGEETGDTTTVYSNASSLTGDRDRNDHPGPVESDYCRILADLLTLSPFHMPNEYERRAVVKAERVRAIQQAMMELNEQQRASLQEELNRGFRDWLVASGNLRQVLDLVHLEKKVGGQ